jgi:hypothetical protein
MTEYAPPPHSPDHDQRADLPGDAVVVTSDGSLARSIPHPRPRTLDWLREGSAVGWPAAGLAGLVLFCIAVQVAWPLGALTHHVSLNNNEGWNAYWSTRALEGQPIYTDADSPLSNNYTPLSFYIVGWFGRAIGDLVLAGRLLSLAGLAGTALLVGAIAARVGKPTRWAWAGAAAFLLIAVTMAYRYVASDDPQWMAEALQLVGLLLLVAPADAAPRRDRVIGACLILLFAGLIKHNQFALPVAITIGLAVHDRRALVTWLTTGAISLGAVLMVLDSLYGPAFIDQVAFHQRVLHLYYLGPALVSLSFLVPASVVAAVYLPRLRGWKSDFRLTILAAFAALAIPLGIFERFGSGVSQNAHFDAVIAVSILLGIVLSSFPRSQLSTVSRLALMTLVVAPAAGKDIVNLPRRIDDWREMNRTDEAWREAIRFLSSQPGPIACERPALCYWAGKPYSLDFSNYGQKLRRSGDPWDLRGKISRHWFSALVIIRDDRYWHGDARLPNDFYQLINKHYRVERVLPDNLYLMVPAT